MILWDVVKGYGQVVLQRFSRDNLLVVFKGQDIHGRSFTRKWILHGKEGPAAAGIPRDDVARFIERHFASRKGEADLPRTVPAGGIDLNDNNMDIQTTGSGTHFQIPTGVQAVAAHDLGYLSPVIVSITPLKDARAFLATP